VNIYNNIEAVPFLQRAIVTIGTFDGVHKAHRCIVNKVSELAKDTKGTSVVITFSSHPRKIINPEVPLNVLTTRTEKNTLLQESGIDVIIDIDFTKSVAEMSYIDFITLLKQRMKITTFVVGYDNNFGKNKEGNMINLKKNMTLLGFDVVEIPKQTLDGIEISSSSIREAINTRNFERANQLLGHNYRLETTIISHSTDYIIVVPTDKEKIVPPKGNYTVKVVNDITWIDVKEDSMYIMCNDNNRSINKENQKITVEFIN
jgi:riboflavin kinase/FMN adenylyltransferase